MTAGAGSVTSAANWSLTRNGVDVTSRIGGITYAFNAATGVYEATLALGSPLLDGAIVLTAKQSILDAQGNAIDGDANGPFGGDFVRSFNVVPLWLRGPEARANTNTTAFQTSPAVAMDAGGNYVVVWQSFGQDGSGYGVYAQRYSSAGVPQGGEFRVNTYTTGSQFGPAVAMDAAGDFVITWGS